MNKITDWEKLSRLLEFSQRGYSGGMPREVYSECGYPESYEGIHSILTQGIIIQAVFGIRWDPNYRGENLPPGGAEGNFVIPHWSAIGKTYQEAFEEVLGALNRTFRLKNVRPSFAGDTFFRLSKRSQDHLDDIYHRQGNRGVMILPAQFGMLHRGRSSEVVRSNFGPNEFGLGAVEVGCMILCHRGRPALTYEKKKGDEDDEKYLSIECPGSEARMDEKDDFGYVPTFVLDEKGLVYSTMRCTNAGEQSGPVTAFNPYV